MSNLENVLMVPGAILAALIILAILRSALLIATVVHELGHWLMAKAFRIYAPIFSLAPSGEPYRTIGTRYGTQFRIGRKLLPDFPTHRYAFGHVERKPSAYVYVMLQPAPEEDLRRIEQETGCRAPASPVDVPRWKQACVNVAGVLANLIAAGICAWPTILAFHAAIPAHLVGKVVFLPIAFAGCMLALLNFLLGVTQLLPVPGSDGRHLLELLKRESR